MMTEHVTVTGSKPYAEVKRELEARLGRLTDENGALVHDERVDDLHAALVRGRRRRRPGPAPHRTARRSSVPKGRSRTSAVYLLGKVRRSA
jgi:hypothetical protein